MFEPPQATDLTERKTKKPQLEKPENCGSMGASAKALWKKARKA